eukprot:CAMPEP_0174746020 /NCGR_PEP_ID=MMETSP1094-20130205/88155_1 /TAXON_ID=156173 /ORGANISM="Chrysochromulina brevifilum, Strain UTEX LB 985" /LENGTH=30 /DNA_ID= /DNA_START= /DNA_END= /DNA_ORIENTATION=
MEFVAARAASLRSFASFSTSQALKRASCAA